MTNNYIRVTVLGTPDPETERVPTLATEVFFFDENSKKSINTALTSAFAWLDARDRRAPNVISTFRECPGLALAGIGC